MGKKNLVVVVGIILILCLGGGYYLLTRTPFEQRPPAVGSAAPRIASSDVFGDMVSSSEFEDSVVIVFFWATWCGPCKDQLQVFEKVYREFEGRGFGVIAVAVDPVEESDIRGMGLTFPVLVANERVLSDFGGIQTVPVTFVIGKDRRILRKHKSYYSEDALRSEIQAALGTARSAP